MPRPGQDRTALAVALREVFRTRGWNGASLSDLAAATGLSRATLYHHFPNGKADMAAAALADVEARLDTELLAPLRARGSVSERLATMTDVLRGYYRDGESGCLLGALSQGQAEHGQGARIATAFGQCIGALRDLAVEAGLAPEEAEENAMATIAALQGALVVAAGTGSTRVFDATLARFPCLLFGGERPAPPYPPPAAGGDLETGR